MNLQYGNSTVYIDPSYPDTYEDRLFDLSVDHDNLLIPFTALRDEFSSRGIELHTADFLFRQDDGTKVGSYYSFGLQGYRKLRGLSAVALRAFVIMEPVVVAKHLYAQLPELTRIFDAVYVYNTEGDGYSLKGVDRSKLHRLDCPLPFNHVIEPYWCVCDRRLKIVVINGHHRTLLRRGELYSERIRAVVELAKIGVVDLFGRGWNDLFSRHSLSWAYVRNRKALLSVYKGSCRSKFEVLSRYHFALCIENQSMKGYISEKMFDCMYAGTIPVYIGAKDVLKYVPEDSFVDGRAFKTYTEMWSFLCSMSQQKREHIREAGRAFLSGASSERFHTSLQRITGII
jgi:hypothetical protein